MTRGPRLDKKTKIEYVTFLKNPTHQEIIDHCKRHGISITSYYRWRKRFKKVIEKPLKPEVSTENGVPDKPFMVENFSKLKNAEMRNERKRYEAVIIGLQKENQKLKDKLINYILKD